MFVLNYKSNISHLSYIGELSAEYPQGPALLYRGHTYCRVMGWWIMLGKKWTACSKILQLRDHDSMCVCSKSVGKSPIPRARPAAARCVATRLNNTNVFWRHSELRQRQGFPTRHLSCSSSCPLNPRYQHPNVSVCVLATWTWSNTIYRQKSCWCLQSCWLRGYISTQPNR